MPYSPAYRAGASPLIMLVLVDGGYTVAFWYKGDVDNLGNLSNEDSVELTCNELVLSVDNVFNQSL